MEFSYIQTRPVLSSSVRFGSWRARCVQFSVVVDRRRHTGLRPCPSVPDKAMTCRRRRRRRSVSPTFPRLDRATGSQDSSENPSAGESSTVGLLLLFLPTYVHSLVPVGVLDAGAEGPGFKSQSRRCRVTVLGKLLTPILPLFTKQRNW